MSNQNISKLYDLLQQNPDRVQMDLSLEEFTSKMGNPNNRKKITADMIKAGYDFSAYGSDIVSKFIPDGPTEITEPSSSTSPSPQQAQQSAPSYDSTSVFRAITDLERSDRATRHNNPGAHIWTPELGEKYGAEKGDSLPDNPNLFTAKYGDVDTGGTASLDVVEQVYGRAGGDIEKFISIYALGKEAPESDEEHQIVERYRRTIERAHHEDTILNQMATDIAGGGDPAQIIESGMMEVIPPNPGTPEYEDKINEMIINDPAQASEIIKLSGQGRPIAAIEAVLSVKNPAAGLSYPTIGTPPAEGGQRYIKEGVEDLPSLGPAEMEHEVEIVIPTSYYMSEKYGAIVKRESTVKKKVGYKPEPYDPEEVAGALNELALRDLEAEGMGREEAVSLLNPATKITKAWRSGVANMKDVGGGIAAVVGWKQLSEDLREEAAREQTGNYIDVLYEEFPEFSKDTFWTDLGEAGPQLGYKFIQNLPIIAPIMATAAVTGAVGAAWATGAGLGAIGTSLVAGVTGALASRPLESAMEAAGTYNAMIDQGRSEAEAMEAFQRVYNDNLNLMMLDAGQIAMMFAKVPKPLRNSLGVWMKGRKTKLFLKAVGQTTAALSEGGEELVQKYYQEAGEAAAKGELEPSLLEAMSLADPEGLEVFLLGVMSGGLFQASGSALRAALAKEGPYGPDVANEVIKELTDRYAATWEAKGIYEQTKDLGPMELSPEEEARVRQEKLDETITGAKQAIVKGTTEKLHQQNRELIGLKQEIGTQLNALKVSLEYESEITNNEDVIADIQAQVEQVEGDLTEVVGTQEEVVRQINTNLGQAPKGGVAPTVVPEPDVVPTEEKPVVAETVAPTVVEPAEGAEEPLLEEAKKFKSAEAFIIGQRKTIEKDLGWRVAQTAKDGRFGTNIVEGGLDKKSAEFEAKKWKEAGGVANVIPPKTKFTPQQLTDIWDKAHPAEEAKPEAPPTIKEEVTEAPVVETKAPIPETKPVVAETVAPTEKPTEAEFKQIWEMTRNEFISAVPTLGVAPSQRRGVQHKLAVEKALSLGEVVPQKVLEAYPELQPKALTKPPAKDLKKIEKPVEESYENADLKAHVKQIKSGSQEGKFSVAFQDKDSGEFIDEVSFYDDKQQAVGYAKKQLVIDGEVALPTTKPPEPKKLTKPEPKKLVKAEPKKLDKYAGLPPQHLIDNYNLSDTSDGDKQIINDKLKSYYMGLIQEEFKKDIGALSNYGGDERAARAATSTALYRGVEEALAKMHSMVDVEISRAKQKIQEEKESEERLANYGMVQPAPMVAGAKKVTLHPPVKAEIDLEGFSEDFASLIDEFAKTGKPSPKGLTTLLEKYGLEKRLELGVVWDSTKKPNAATQGLSPNFITYVPKNKKIKGIFVHEQNYKEMADFIRSHDPKISIQKDKTTITWSDPKPVPISEELIVSTKDFVTPITVKNVKPRIQMTLEAIAPKPLFGEEIGAFQFGMLLKYQKELAKKGIDPEYVKSPVWTVAKDMVEGRDIHVLVWEGVDRSYQIPLEDNIADKIKEVTEQEDIVGTRLEFSEEFFGKRVATPEGVSILGVELEIAQTKQNLTKEGVTDAEVTTIEEKADRTESGQINTIADEVKANETEETRIAGAEVEGVGVGEEARAVKPSDIEDFGEKIGGARKDVYTVLQDATEHDTPTVPLSQSFPEPKYDKLLEEGTDPHIVASVRAMRDEIPSKPRQRWKLERWSTQVELLRGFSQKLLNNDISIDKYRERMEENPVLRDNVLGRIDLYMAVGHDISLKGLTLKKIHWSLYKGEEDVTKWMVSKRGRVSIFSNMGITLGEGATKEDAITQFQENYKKLKEDKQTSGKKIKFAMYSFRDKPGKVWVGKKVGSSYLDLKAFDNRVDARKYLNENYDELVTLLEKAKYIPNERRATNNQRVGIDRRNGKDTTAEMFMEAFGFRGVEFGNWVKKSGERQELLNKGYDALYDLAEVLEIPTRAISLNGELGLAFGARGVGGVSPAAAHYEPGKVVINLTRMSGAGSLAHEWWHATDNYFSRMRKDKSGFISERPYELSPDHRQVRGEVIKAFSDIVTAYKKTGIVKRSAALDTKRSKAYWGQGKEITARIFENYIIRRLANSDISNDYLVNIKENTEFMADMVAFVGGELSVDEFYPYLLDNEIDVVSEAFDKFFKTVQTRETDAGNVQLFQRPAPIPGERISDEQIKQDAELLSKAVSGVNVVRDAKEYDRVTDLRTIKDRPLGFYDPQTSTVYIDPRRAQGDTVFHEFSHPVIHYLKSSETAHEKAMYDQGIELVRGTEYETAAKRDYTDLSEAEQLDEALVSAIGEKASGMADTARQNRFKAWLQRVMMVIRRVFKQTFGISPTLDEFTSALAGKLVSGKPQFDITAQDEYLQFQDDTGRPIFYSTLMRGISQAQVKAPAAQWKGMISKMGVKKEEIEWSGVMEWLDDQTGSVTKVALMDYLRANEVKVEEVVRGGPTEEDIDVFLGDEAGEGFTRTEAREYLSDDETYTTKFEQHTLPGGTNYRELVLTLPVSKEVARGLIRLDKAKKMFREGDIVYGVDEAGKWWEVKTEEDFTTYDYFTDNPEGVATSSIQEADRKLKTEFRSGHFDEPNIVTHVRFNERTDEAGNRVLFIEEIQSDWHQQGRKKGYGTVKQKTLEEWHRDELGGGEITPEDIRRFRRYQELGDPVQGFAPLQEGVPDAPFKKTWHELALKRMLRYAAENGFDKLAWTTGTQQAERYDLSKHIESITYGSDNSLVAYNKDGDQVIGRTVPEAQLEDTIGKEATEKLIKQKPNADGERFLSNQDLKVGGEGMKGFYDKIVPRFLNKYAKKWGAKVEGVGLRIAPSIQGVRDLEVNFRSKSEYVVSGWNGNKLHIIKRPDGSEMLFKNREEAQGWIDNATEAAFKDQPSIDITPAMRESVLQGQPQFQKRLVKPADLVTELKEVYDSAEFANKHDFIVHLKEAGYDARTIKRASNMFPEISGELQPKRLQKATERLEGKIEKPAQLIRKYSSTFIKDRIAALKSGARLGAQERSKELEKLKMMIQRYARTELPKYLITRGQITPLITEVAKAKNINDVVRAFDRIDAIRAKVHKKAALNKFAKTIKKYQPKKEHGKIIGKHLMPKEYRDLNDIRNIVGMDRPVVDETIASIMMRAEGQGRDVNDLENRLVYLLGTYGALKNKTSNQILTALEDMNSIIETGKTIHQLLEERRKDYNAGLRKKTVSVITGGKGVLRTMEQRKLKLDERTRRLAGLKDYLYSNQSFEYMMDIFEGQDKTTKPVKGFLAQRYGNLIHEATREAGQARREKYKLVESKIQSIYGKGKWRMMRILADNSERVNTGIFYEKGGEQVELIMSKNEAYKKWMEWQDPELEETFEKMGWTEDTIKEVEEFAGPELIKWATWQIDEFYPQYYQEINEVFKERFFIDLPQHDFYSPRQRVGKQTEKEDDQLLNSSRINATLINGSLKSRIKNTRELKYLDGDATLLNHIVQMEHFKAWAMPMQELRSVFGSEDVQRAIGQEYGRKALSILNNYLDDFARGGMDRTKAVAWMDRLRGRFVKSKIALTPVITLKQLTSIPAFAINIPTADFAKGMVDFWIHPIKNFKTLWKSEYLKERYTVGFERDIVEMLKRTTAQRLSGVKTFSDILTWNVKLGDGAAIIVGGWSVYKYYYDRAIKGGKTVEEAKRVAMNRFERISDRTQQSGALASLSEIQRGGSMAKLFTVFVTAQNQYFRAEMGAVRNLARGRGSKVENFKTILVTHFILPMLFQFVASGFRWDEKKQFRAMLIGSLNGLLIFGDILERVVESLVSGFSFESETAKPFSTFDDLARVAQKTHGSLADGDIDFEEFVAIADKSASVISSFLGAPYDPGKRLVEGFSDYATGETDDERRLLGFSDWSLGKRGKKGKKTLKRKSIRLTEND